MDLGLIQFGNPGSGGKRARRTASSALIAPLVFGRIRYRFGSRNSRMFAYGSFFPLRSARRSATVTISAPLAASASRIASGDENFPVPRMRRELNRRPAITSEPLTGNIGRKDKFDPRFYNC